MKNKKTFFSIALVFVLLIGGATVLYRQLGKNIAAEQLATQSTNQSDESAAGETEQKIKAPDFTVYDADGNEVHLADYIGKPIVLNFWASWCGPCQSEICILPSKHCLSVFLGYRVVNNYHLVNKNIT